MATLEDGASARAQQDVRTQASARTTEAWAQADTQTQARTQAQTDARTRPDAQTQQDAPVQANAPARTDRKARRGIPLSLVIARYFAYAVCAVALIWLASFALFSSVIEAGIVYPASYGAAHARETAEDIAAAETFEADTLASTYRYALFSADGAVLDTNLPEGQLAQAKAQLPAAIEDAAENGGRAGVSGGGATTYAVAVRTDGTLCLLTSTYLPQFTSLTLRESLPNPQNIWLASGAAASLLAAALVARRAGRILFRKMEPLLAVADNVGKRNLDFPVGASNVREVGRVLDAMEEMRVSLKSSLEAQWDAERQQREQIAALAHDLKTPLTVIRANADFLAEETLDAPDLADAAGDTARAAEKLDRYVRLLIEASRGDKGEALHLAPLSARTFCNRLTEEAAPVAKAEGIGFVAHIAPELAEMQLCADSDALVRAGMNAIANAVEHARAHVSLTCELAGERDGAPSPAVTAPGRFPTAGATPLPHAPTTERSALQIRIEDDGEGFTAQALVHGCERFWRADSSRTGNGHYGIGLATALETAQAHGGSLTLANRLDGNGSTIGAKVTLRIPCTPILG